MSASIVKRSLGVIVVVCFVSFFMVILAEVLTRWLEGLPLTQLRLPTSSHANLFPPGRRNGTDYIARIPIAEGVNSSWFALDPPLLPGRDHPTPELLALQDKVPVHGVAEFDMYKSWNRRFLDQERCGYFRNFPGFAYAFEPIEPIPHPRYRYRRNAVTPLQLVTNQFGWRGPQVDLNKPDHTIRIAFVGASTTVGYHRFPHSYPELVGHWLSIWSKKVGLPVQFEVVNAAREGINSTDIAAVVRQELLPIEPDLVVYYEGSNEFAPGTVVSVAGLIPRSLSLKEKWDGLPWVIKWSRYSVLLHRVSEALGVLSAGDGKEPTKPESKVMWPDGLDEVDPLLSHPQLPVNLPQILSNLDVMRAALGGSDSELIMTSFVWLAYDGMELNPTTHHSIYRYLNGTFYPFRYKDIRRLADFQNRVFSKYAAAHGLEFIDVDKWYPRDPDLFTDAIHQTYAGVRLRAWIVLQQLIPILKHRLESGRLPRPDQEWIERHPAFSTPETTVDVHC